MFFKKIIPMLLFAVFMTSCTSVSKVSTDFEAKKAEVFYSTDITDNWYE